MTEDNVKTDSLSSIFVALRNGSSTPFIFCKHTLFWAKPLKEIEITTNKLTTMCLKYGQFAA